MKKNLLKGAFALSLVFIASTSFAKSNEVTVYNKDGIKLSFLEENKELIPKLENNSLKDMFDVKLLSKNTSGLKIKNGSFINVGTLKKGDKKTLDKEKIKFEIEEKIKEKIKNGGLLKTGVSVNKFLIPISIAGVFGVFFVLVKEKRCKKFMSIALATSLLATSLGLNVDAKEKYDHEINIKSDIKLDGKNYEYIGVLYYNDTEKEGKNENKEDKTENNDKKENNKDNKKEKNDKKEDKTDDKKKDNDKKENNDKKEENVNPNSNKKEDSKKEEKKEEDSKKSDEFSKKSIEITVLKDSKPLENSDVRLFEWDGIIPNVIKVTKTDKNGKIIFKDFKKNTNYEIRMENKNFKFDKDVVKFETNEMCEISKIQQKNIKTKKDLEIIFNAYEKNSKDLKVTAVKFTVVDKNTKKAVEGVEFTANTLQPKLQSYKNAKSNSKGEVNFELEGATGKKMYTICVSKNAQFYYTFTPEEITITIDENGKVIFKDGVSPRFEVLKQDVSYLKENLKEKIKEAENLVKNSNFSKDVEDLKNVIKGAKEELNKKETIPYYVKGFIDELDKAMSKIKNTTEEKVIIPMIMVQKETAVLMENLTFILSDSDGNEKEITSTNSILMNIEVTKNKEYTLKLKENEKYTFKEVKFVVKDQTGEPKIVGSDETLAFINILDKKSEVFNLNLRGENILSDKEKNIEKGTKVKITLSPDAKYRPNFFTVNGKDHLKDLKEVKLTEEHKYKWEYEFNVEENTEIIVTYERFSELSLSEGLKLISPNSLKMNKGQEYIVEILTPEKKTLKSLKVKYFDKQQNRDVDFDALGQVKKNRYTSYLDTCTSITAEFEDLKPNFESDFTFNENTKTITDYKYNGQKDVIIPKTIKGTEVKHIDSYVFNEKGINSIVIPEGVETIGDQAFMENSIKKLYLPKSLKKLGSGAFANNEIESLTLLNKDIELGDGAFMYNKLKTFEFSNNLKVIPRRILEGNEIETITIPEIVTHIKEKAFYKNKLKNIDFPESVKNIDNLAFRENEIKNVNFKNTDVKYRPNAFDTDVKTNVEENENFVIPKNYEFEFDKTTGTITAYKGNDWNIEIPSEIDGVKVLNIETKAQKNSWDMPFEPPFKGKALNKVKIQHGITHIGKEVFKDNNLVEVILPESLVSIGKDAFSNNDLKNVNLPSNLVTLQENVFRNNRLTNIDLKNVKNIEKGALADNFLTSINLPSDLTDIDDEILQNNKLTSVIIPKTVKRIGKSSFSGNLISSLEIPNSVEKIDDGAFSSNNITSLIVNENVKTIGKAAFSFNGMESLEVKAKTEILNKAFYMNKIKNLKLSDDVILKEGEIFQFNALESVKIPKATKKLPHLIFAANQIKNVTFHDSLEEIGYGALYVNKLTNVEIPDCVKVIGNAAFFNNHIKSLKLSKNLTKIESGTFRLNKLTNVEIPNSVKIIEEGAFKENKINEVNILKDVNLNLQAFDRDVKINRK